MGKSLIITGSSGYIGKRLVKSINDDGDTTIQIRKDNEENYQWGNDNYLDSIFKKAVSSNPEVKVIHIATKYEPFPSFSEQLKTNILLPLRMIEYSIKYNVKSFINIDTFFTNTSFPNRYPRLPSYVLSKAQLKEWFIFFHEKIYITNCKIFHVYGPDDNETKFVTMLVNKLKENHGDIELSSCETIRDFIYIDDVISGLKKIIDNDDGNIFEYEIGTSVGTSVRKFCELAKNISNSKTFLKFGKSSLHGDLGSQIANIDQLKKLNWEPKFDIHRGLTNLCNPSFGQK